MLLALVGNPVAHSKSPQIHGAFAEQCGLRVDYRKELAEPDAFVACAERLRSAGARGCNVTIPFKQHAFAYCGRLSERARRAGAVNTIVFEPDHTLGDNTDGAGLMRDLTVNLGVTVAGARTLLLGAGGAARGILAPLLDAAPASVHIANRTAARAGALAGDFADLAELGHSGFEDLPQGPFDLIVNATSASLEGSCPPLPAEVLAPGGTVYDAVYADSATAFMRWGERAGAACSADGLGMLLEQAAESFRLWTGHQPDTAPVLKAMRPGAG